MRINMFKLPVYLILFFCLQGCAKGDLELGAVIPLYSACEGYVKKISDELGEKYEGTDMQVQFKKVDFDFKSSAHPEIVGYLEIYGKSLEISYGMLVNEIKDACMPEKSMITENDSHGYRSVIDQVKRNKSNGIGNNFIQVRDDGKLHLYY